MSTFTMTLKGAIEATGGTTELRADGVTVMTGGNIGLGYYECYEPVHKEILDGKIIDHYWNREIGQETVQMFQLAMRRKMNEIMPYYNELYRTETIAFDPLSTIKIHTVAVAKTVENAAAESEANSTSESKSGSRSVQSQFPQVTLSPDADYATSAADANSTSDATSVGTNNSTSESETDNDTDTQVEGYQAYPSNLIAQYRAIILNIDMMIIQELDELFMQVWNNNDEYSSNRLGGYWPYYF